MKYLSLILSLTLVFASVPCGGNVSASGIYEDNADSPAYSLLSDLDIMDISECKPSSRVTRAEFCALISRMLNLSGISNGEISFNDVDTSHKHYSDIANVFEWGIISAAAHFRPDDAITSYEAAKMAVSALGYDFLAESKGGWPIGYAAAASSLGLDVASEFTAAAAAELAYDMLNCKLPFIAVVDSNFQYYPGQGDTILQKVWGLNCLTGKITDGQYFGLTNPKGAGEDSVIIDGYLLNKGKFDTDRLIGETVDVYYNNKLVICSVYNHNELNSLCETVYSPQDISCDGGTYEYYSDKSQKNERINLSSAALIVYNGKQDIYNAEHMIPENGYIKFIKNSAGEAEIVIIKDYEQVAVGEIAASEELVSDALFPGTGIILGGDNVSFVNQNGDEAYITDISSGDVLWIAASTDGELTEVIICKDIIIGEYTGKSASGNYVYIDNGEYPAGEYAVNQLANEFTMGEIVTAYVNPYGEIVYFQKSSDTAGREIGYLIESTLMNNGFDKSIHVKILNTDGTIVIKKLAQKFTLNAITFKGDTLTNYTSLPKQAEKPESMQRGIISYYTDDNGDISSVNYSDDNAAAFGGKNTGLYKTGELDGYDDNYIEYKRTGAWITGKSPERIFVKSSTIMFIVPRSQDIGNAEDDNYRVENVSSYSVTKDISNRHLTGYTLSDDSDTSDYVVSQYVLGSSSQSVSATSTLYMVEKLSSKLDKDGVPQAVLTVKSASNTATEFYSEDENYFTNIGLGFGDVVKISADSSRIVKGVLIIYHPGDKELKNVSTFSGSQYTSRKSKSVLTNNTGMGSIAGSYVVGGNVYQKGTSGMNVLPFNTDPLNYNGEELHGYTLKDVKFLLCDTEKETIVSGTTSSIKSFADFGTDCSVAVIETRSGHISSMLIYN